MIDKDLMKIITIVASEYTRGATKDWLLRRGFERWIAELLAMTAGAVVSVAVLRLV